MIKFGNVGKSVFGITFLVAGFFAPISVQPSFADDGLHECTYNDVTATYTANEVPRIRNLGGECSPLSAINRVTCTLGTIRRDYTRAELVAARAEVPQLECVGPSNAVVFSSTTQTSTTGTSTSQLVAEAYVFSATVTSIQEIAVDRGSVPQAGELIFFKTGSSRLDRADKNKIIQFADNLDHWSGYFSIAGYADAVGSSGLNHNLSLKRALAVRDFMFSLGIDKSKLISVSAHGEELQLVKTANNISEQGNRVVQIIYYTDK